MMFKGLNITGMLTKTIVATKERLEGVRGEEGEGALEAVTPAQQRREMELVRKEVYIPCLAVPVPMYVSSIYHAVPL